VFTVRSEEARQLLGNHEHAIMLVTAAIKSTQALQIHTQTHTHIHTCCKLWSERERACISYDLLLFRVVFRYYLNFK